MKKSIGELLDELIITHIKLFHVIEDKHQTAADGKLEESGRLGITEDTLNGHRSALRNAINDYFGEESKEVKVGIIKKLQK